MRSLIIAPLVLALCASPAAAQKTWKEIGTTASGNKVSVDTRSVKRAGNLVSATVRVVFLPVVQTPKGPWASAQTKATVDCSRKLLAAKENAYFADTRGSKVVERKVNKIPGYGQVLEGSLGSLAVKYLCK